MTTDTLSDVLRTVRLRGAVFYAVSVGSEWSVEAPPAAEIAATVIPGAGHVMEYHVIVEGSAWAALAGQPAVRLAAGDVVVFPQGDSHVLCSAPGIAPMRFSPDWVLATRDVPKPMPVALFSSTDFAWGAPACTAPDNSRGNIVCGFLGCDHGPFNPLLAALPRLLHVPADGDGAWIRHLMRQAVLASHSDAPGGIAVVERISEMMFIDAIQRHARQLPDHATGWLAGLRDRHVGRALALIHEQPQHGWTVAALGRASALSRSAFCERFSRLVGMAPAQYLAHWRMEVAATLLRQSRAPVAAIAQEVGYESEAAFTRAFGRIVGMPPARWRRSVGGAVH